MTSQKTVNAYLETLFSSELKVKKFMKVAGAVVMRINEDERKQVLLIRRSVDDHWPLHYEFPRGKCDKPVGEKLIHCLKREVKEETGLDVIPLKLIDKFSYIADKGTRKSTQYNFLCKLKNPNQKIKLSKEHDQFRWVGSVGEVELLVYPELKKTISKVLNVDEQIVNYPENELEDESIEE